jgi:hypothetical protein
VVVLVVDPYREWHATYQEVRQALADTMMILLLVMPLTCDLVGTSGCLKIQSPLRATSQNHTEEEAKRSIVLIIPSTSTSLE